jgi:hypothetical protein
MLVEVKIKEVEFSYLIEYNEREKKNTYLCKALL